MDLPPPPRSLLHLSLEFVPLDLSSYPARTWTVEKAPKPVEDMTEEEWLTWEAGIPKIPAELDHWSLEEVEVDWGNPFLQEESPEKETFLVPRGRLSFRLHCPVNPQTFICYVCRRPLELFRLRVSTGDPNFPRGWCPKCLLEKEWRKEWRGEMLGKGEDPVQRKRVKGQKGEQWEFREKTELQDRFVDLRTQTWLSEWRLRDLAWWEDQKRTNTEVYSKWRTKQLSLLPSSLGPTR